MPAASPDKLLEKLSHGKPVAAIVLEGSDSYLREMCRNRIIEAYVPEGMRDWAVGRMSARESGWDEIVQRAQTLPMMAPVQVIFVQDAESVERFGDKARDQIVAALGEYLDSPAPFTVLVLEASSILDKRQRFYKLLAEKAISVELTIGAESAPVFATQMAKQLGVEIDRDSASFLAEILNGEPARMHIELEKLAVYVQGTNRIGIADVEAVVVAARKNTVWQFADVIAEGNRKLALERLDNLLREGEQPAGMVGAIAWRYRQLIENRGLVTKSYGQSARYGGSSFSSQPAARVPMKYLISGLKQLAEADSQLKSSNPDPRTFMEFLVARLTMRSAADVSEQSGVRK
jgi:DNA polymerase-3 subunit delta